MEQGGVFRLRWSIALGRIPTSFNPFGAGQGLSTLLLVIVLAGLNGFNPFGAGRGFSTYLKRQFYLPRIVSIPLEQGEVFRPKNIFCITGLIKVSIPLEQGGVFRPMKVRKNGNWLSFNPFGTGRGLSTEELWSTDVVLAKFQSLWNRAGSFDVS